MSIVDGQKLTWTSVLKIDMNASVDEAVDEPCPLELVGKQLSFGTTVSGVGDPPEYRINVEFNRILFDGFLHGCLSSAHVPNPCVLIRNPLWSQWGYDVIGFHVPDDALIVNFVPLSNLCYFTFGASSKVGYLGDREIADGVQMIKTVVLPSSLSTLGDSCFRRCQYLRCVMFDVPSNLTWIKAFAFAKTGIEEIVIPDSVLELGDCCFFGCKHLRRVTCTKVKKIGHQCFASTSLERFVIPSTVKYIGGSAFAPCPLTEGLLCADDSRFMVRDALLLNKDRTCCYSLYSQVARVCIPSSVCEIVARCFTRSRRLNYVYFDESCSLEHFGGRAFRKTGIMAIRIPDKVRELDELCFSDCNQLSLVEFGSESLLEVIGYCAFKSTSIEQITIPDSVRKLCSLCFSGCSNLKCVNFGESSLLETLGRFTFDRCGLKSITIPDRVREIPLGCFAHCSSLRDVKFGPSSSLELIGPSAFQSTGILQFHVPAKVRVICDYSFARMFGCVTFECMDTLERVSPWAFEKIRSGQEFNLPPTCERRIDGDKEPSLSVSTRPFSAF